MNTKSTALRYFIFTPLLLACAPLYAGDVKVNLHGTLLVPTCDLDIISKEQTIPLGTFLKATLQEGGKSKPKAFSLTFKPCQTAKKISVSFTGKEESYEPGTLAIEGWARGISIGLTDDKDQPILLNKTSLSYALGGAGATTLNFKAYVQAVDGKRIDPGTFQATVNFALAYP